METWSRHLIPVLFNLKSSNSETRIIKPHSPVLLFALTQLKYVRQIKYTPWSDRNPVQLSWNSQEIHTKQIFSFDQDGDRFDPDAWNKVLIYLSRSNSKTLVLANLILNWITSSVFHVGEKTASFFGFTAPVLQHNNRSPKSLKCPPPHLAEQWSKSTRRGRFVKNTVTTCHKTSWTLIDVKACRW